MKGPENFLAIGIHNLCILKKVYYMKKNPGGFIVFIRKFMLALPGVSEGICFGTVAFYVRKKLLARMKEDDVTLVVYTPDRDEWTDKNPTIFYITDHYKNYPFVLVDLATVKQRDLSTILFEAWKNRAGKKLISLLKQED